MRRAIVWIMVLLFVNACADSEHMTQYYQLEQARTDALIASMERQSADISHNKTLAMGTYSSAISAAAITQSPSDDIAIALAWGYFMGAPQRVNVPNLQPVKAPPTNVEYIRAWSPIIGMAVPLLWGAVWNAGSSSGTSISANDGSNIVFDSGNAGSYNTAGYDMMTEIGVDGSSNLGVLNNSAPLDLEVDVDGAGTDSTCDINPDGLACEGCSCSSLLAGDCVCPELY
jgi:hypothetical protein